MKDLKKIIVCSYDEKLLPEKATHWSVCRDFKSANDCSVDEHMEVKLIWTWLKIALPTWWGTKLYVRSSSPIKKWYMSGNSVGIIDADYRWEYLLQVINIRKESVKFEKYQRIWQMEFAPFYIWSGEYGCGYIPEIEFVVDKDLYDNFEIRFSSDRGAGWFGSTWNK